MNVWVKRAGERLALVNWPGSQGSNHTAQPFEIRMVSSTFELLDSWKDSRCDEWIKSYADPSVPFSYIQPPQKPYCYAIEIVAMPIRIIGFVLRLTLQMLFALIYVALRILSFLAAFLLHCWSVALKGIWHTIIEFIAHVSFPILLFLYVITQWKLLLLVAVIAVFVIYTPRDFAG
ncbi:MAG: hypothetical protein M1839_009468 [Geoglossum umbratile]|nr:MAG: hypothetical protein M1839_009468 [Geoglossum umbratile]